MVPREAEAEGTRGENAPEGGRVSGREGREVVVVMMGVREGEVVVGGKGGGGGGGGGGKGTQVNRTCQTFI